MRDVIRRLSYFRNLWLLMVFAIPGAFSEVDVTVTHITPAANLLADAQRAAKEGIPILVAVTREECGFCEQLKREILIPMKRSGDYEDKVIMRELNVDWQAKVTDFDGKRLSTTEFAERYDSLFTPTVLVLGPGGREAAKRLVGINTVEMYGFYLDAQIESAIQQIRGKKVE